MKKPARSDGNLIPASAKWPSDKAAICPSAAPRRPRRIMVANIVRQRGLDHVGLDRHPLGKKVFGRCQRRRHQIGAARAHCVSSPPSSPDRTAQSAITASAPRATSTLRNVRAALFDYHGFKKAARRRMPTCARRLKSQPSSVTISVRPLQCLAPLPQRLSGSAAQERFGFGPQREGKWCAVNLDIVKRDDLVKPDISFQYSAVRQPQRQEPTRCRLCAAGRRPP